MSYCTKLTNNNSDYPLTLSGIKELLNIDPDDITFDNKIKFYFKVAIEYLQNNYDLVILKNDYLCSYGKDYIEYKKNHPLDGTALEITLPQKVNQIYDVAKVITTFPSNITIGTTFPQPDNSPTPLNIESVLRTPLKYTLNDNIIKICCHQYFCFYECKDIKVEIKCSLGWEMGGLPYDLQQVLFSLVTDFFNNMGECDCKKVCENKFNSTVLSNYQSFIF